MFPQILTKLQQPIRASHWTNSHSSLGSVQDLRSLGPDWLLTSGLVLNVGLDLGQDPGLVVGLMKAVTWELLLIWI